MINCRASLFFAIVASFASIGCTNGMTLNFTSVWFKRPYKGPEVVVEVVGADMNVRANRFFDFWSKPDTYVTCHHGDCDRKTQIEGNTYTPRWLWQAKLPFKRKFGFHFQVMEANVIKGDSVMGRAFIDTEQAGKLIDSGEPALLSMGENIGKIKIQLSHLPENLQAAGTSKAIPLDDKPQETGLRTRK